MKESKEGSRRTGSYDMPLPEPSNNEDKQDFISRCMSNDNIKKEFSSHKQRLAVCFSQWKRKNENALSIKIHKYITREY